ncbi:hypothetical protein AB0T83_00415 [Fluviibacterium sp. DFM31]|uniref:Uncharacterized protein n=2 Tax=Meridianimarinicoccus marinus TaxID=3231483 RepID=A0ABV3L109_9RHOB
MGRRVPLPLVVDVDGALLQRGLCHSILRTTLRRAPWMTRRHWHGRRTDLTAITLAEALPNLEVPVSLNRDLLSQIAVHHRLGGITYLMGQAQAGMLAALGDFLGIEAQVLGSDADMPLDRIRQAHLLPTLFGSKGFILIGGRRSGEALCLAARECWLVDGTPGMKRRLRTHGGRMTVLPPPLWLPLRVPMARICGIGMAGGGPSLGQLASRAVWMRETEKTRPAGGAPETQKQADARRRA